MASYSKQVMDFRAATGVTANVSNEHQRNWSERGWQYAAKHGNYDPTRRHLNFEVAKGCVVQQIDTSQSIPQRMKANLAARGIEDPNVRLKKAGRTANRRTVVNIIFGGSRNRMHELAYGNQTVDLGKDADNSHITRNHDIEEWTKDIYRFACDKWGEENIIGFYVHLDEKNPHIHCSVMPITQANKFSFKDIFAGKDKVEFMERTRRLHDELAVVNERWGLGRGNPIMESGARHRTSEEYRLSLRKECTDLENEVGEHRRTLEELQSAIRLAERRVKGLNTMVANLEQKQSDLSDEIETLEAQIASGAGDAEDIRTGLSELEAKLRSTTASLEDKRQKLRNADLQLANLRDEMESVKRDTASLQRENAEAFKDSQTRIRMQLIDSVFGKTIVDLRPIMAALSPEEKLAFDAEFLNDLAEKPGEILKCAMYLFAGYVDGAIQFAKGSGGGGGGSDLKWGRDPDEDDRKWAYRCMMQAHKMMRPPQGKQVKR